MEFKLVDPIAPARPPSGKGSISKTFVNRAGLHCLFWLVMQQLVVALSTAFLIAAAQFAEAADLRRAGICACAFGVALSVVYIPNTLSLIHLQKWRTQSFFNYIKTFYAKSAGRATRFAMGDKSVYESWLTNEGFSVYERATSTIYEFCSIGLSLFLNVLVIAAAIDSMIMYCYLLAACAVGAYCRIYAGEIGRSALKAQGARNDLWGALLRAWDNIFGGGDRTRRAWGSEFEERLGSFDKASVSYDRTRALISSLMAVTAIAIIASGNFIHYTIVSGEPTKVVALFITLPRQAMMVQCIFGFFNAFLSWQGDRRQLDALGKAIHMLGDQDVSERIRFSSISINVNGKLTEFSSIDALATKVADCGAGRITLRGANGSGKTTLLAYFAELYKSRAFFLPTRNSEIYFSAQSLGSLSDGVRLRAIINEMVAFDEVSIFLLDEWDANLDSENMFEIDAMIEGIAARRLVIESRHR